MNTTGEILLYQPDETVKLEVRMDKETIWLTQQQIAELFGTRRQAITKHLKHIFASGELNEFSVCSVLELTASDGKVYNTKVYNLDAILSVGYRVNSIQATNFRKWANKVLTEYLLHGYSINQRFNSLERRMEQAENKIDFFVRTSLPPVEGIFYQGQIFDAYVFVANLIKSAQKSIVLIDNYIDESVFTMLDKRNDSISATIYTKTLSKQLELDVQKHNEQYKPIELKIANAIHDRFLLIDNDVYHIGASLKDLGKKLFAFSKFETKANEILQLLN